MEFVCQVGTQRLGARRDRWSFRLFDDAVNKKRSLSFADSERSQIARRGFEPRLSDSESLKSLRPSDGR